MNNKDILQKLIKITNSQQKMLMKLAQATQPENNLIVKAHDYVKSMTNNWILSNDYQLKYNVSLSDASDPNYNYELKLVVLPASGTTVPADFSQKYKDYMGGKLATNPLFQGVNFKIEVQTSPTL